MAARLCTAFSAILVFKSNGKLLKESFKPSHISICIILVLCRNELEDTS